MIGDVLSQLMKEQGVNDRQLAEMTGLSEPTIWKIRNGQTDTKSGNLKKIADALKVEPGVFFEKTHNLSYDGANAS